MTSEQQRLDDASRHLLAGLADVLIPAGAGLPSAMAVGVHLQLVDRVLAARPDLSSGLLDVIAASTQRSPREAVDHLRSNRPDLFEVLTLVIAGGYLMSQEVGAELNYQGQEAKLVDPGDVIKTISSGRLDAVVAREAIWRRPPDAPEDAE